MMRNSFAPVLGAFAALVFTALQTAAVEPRFAQLLPPTSEPSLAGLQVSLTTSGYKFFLAEPAAAIAPALRPVREWFLASALLANRSNTDIGFTFPTPAAAQYKWTFRIFNSDGERLWQSDSDVITPQVLTEANLEKRGRWKRLVQVPLRIDGKLLAPGLYTLEASLDADKALGATLLFEVATPPLAR